MPWLKVSDLFASHPMLMRLVTAQKADERTINEVTGFIARLGAGAAAHMTDYRVDLGTASMYGQARTEILLRQAVEVGLMTVEGRGKNRMWKIVEDGDLIHMRSKAEIEWERQQRRDVTDKKLTLSARRRDGDACRYCATPVDWKNRRGARGGTYDHLIPGQPATLDTLVVSCKACNSSLGDTDVEARQERILPVPEQPLYQDETVTMLAAHGIRVTQARPEPTDPAATARPTTVDPAAPARPTGTDNAATARPTRPTAATARAASTDAATAANRREVETAPQPPRHHTSGFAQRMEHDPPPWALEGDDGLTDLQKPADSHREQVYGPGRDGQGLEGTGAASAPPEPSLPSQPGHAPTHQQSASRRGRRGRRSKKE